jgi:O-antigen/teichoic acid export membrane protein
VPCAYGRIVAVTHCVPSVLPCHGCVLLVVQGVVQLGVLLLLHARTHLKKKKKKIAPVTRMVVVTRRFVTYGIRAGSTRDLGFATGSVDMIMLIILSLIKLIVVCR